MDDLLSVGIGTGYQILDVGGQVSFCGCFHAERWCLLLTKTEEVFKTPAVGFDGAWTELPVGLKLEPLSRGGQCCNPGEESP